MTRGLRAGVAAICAVLAVEGFFGVRCARGQAGPDHPDSVANAGAGSEISGGVWSNEIGKRGAIAIGRNSYALGVPFLRDLFADQKTIWTSPARLRWADATWLFPLAGVTAGFLASDRAVPPALPTNPATRNRFTSLSNDGVFTLVGAGAGLYAWGKLSHDDRQREAGRLAGEAAIDSLAVDTALKYAFGRARPSQDAGLGRFYQGGTSFPSDHSALAWSIASVVAHEYPGPITEIAAYGLATTVSASRVLGKQHFPSDVVVGAAIGWLVGREVYHAHHDPELGGASIESFSASDIGEDHRERRDMGSPFVPLDSWVYGSFERLVALGYVQDALLGLKPWTRLECARLTEEAGEALPRRDNLNEEAARLESALEHEFAYELNLLSGGRNFTTRLESIYLRAVSISGQPLTDGYHFGQTVAYDFGRPFERGTNGQAGGSFYSSAGPLTLYIRAEYQHAPSSPTRWDSLWRFPFHSPPPSPSSWNRPAQSCSANGASDGEKDRFCF